MNDIGSGRGRLEDWPPYLGDPLETNEAEHAKRRCVWDLTQKLRKEQGTAEQGVDDQRRLRTDRQARTRNKAETCRDLAWQREEVVFLDAGERWQQ